MTHEHGDEPFPRHALVDLVGAEETGRARRLRAQGWLIGAALALLALALPTQRLVRIDPTLWGPDANALPYPLIAPAVQALATLVGRSYESAWYLVSAILWGLSLPVLLGTLRRLGFAHETALLAALTALLAPAAWVGATLPGTFGSGVFGASLLMACLFAGPSGRRAAPLAFLSAAVLNPEHVWLLPAAVWALRREKRTAAVVVLASAAYLFVLYAGSAGRREWFASDVLGADRLGSALDVVVLIPGLGVAAYGLFGLFDPRRRPEESPPPGWLIPWCAALLFAFLPGHPGAAPLGTFLVPAAALGLADAYQRAWREDRIVPRGLGLLLVQILGTAVLSVILARTDPLAEWREPARRYLKPTDWVYTWSPERLYLLRARWGVEAYGSGTGVEELTILAERADSEGRRAIADGIMAARDRGRNGSGAVSSSTPPTEGPPEGTTHPALPHHWLPRNAGDRLRAVVRVLLTREGLVSAPRTPW